MSSDEEYKYIQLLKGEQALTPYRQLQQVLPFSCRKNGIVALVKQSEWVAVPVESNGHFGLEFKVQLQKMTSEQGVQNIFAVLIETPETHPVAYKIPTTPEGIAEFDLVCGAFNCALFAEDLNWVIVCTVDEYYIVAGQEPSVFHLLCANPDRAFAEFKAYFENAKWVEALGDGVLAQFQTHLNSVLSALKDYRQLQPNSSVNLPPI